VEALQHGRQHADLRRVSNSSTNTTHGDGRRGAFDRRAGASGRGITEHFGIDPARSISLSARSRKPLPPAGFIAGRKPVIEWLRFTLPACMFSVGLSPVIAAAVRKGLPFSARNVADRTRPGEFRFSSTKRAREDLNVGAPSARRRVHPVSKHEVCMEAAEKLLQAGYYAPRFHDGGAKNKPRILFYLRHPRAGRHHRPLDVLATRFRAARDAATGCARRCRPSCASALEPHRRGGDGR